MKRKTVLGSGVVVGVIAVAIVAISASALSNESGESSEDARAAVQVAFTVLEQSNASILRNGGYSQDFLRVTAAFMREVEAHSGALGEAETRQAYQRGASAFQSGGFCAECAEALNRAAGSG